jgi:hypothetical protein
MHSAVHSVEGAREPYDELKDGGRGCEPGMAVVKIFFLSLFWHLAIH